MDNFSPKLCQHCNKPLVGRIDKLFCDDYCRSGHHNRNTHLHEKNIQRINRAIRKNRSILKKLSPSGKTLVRRELVESLGFDFQYFSSLYISNQSTYYMNYDYGFRLLMDSGKYKIQVIQQQEYFESFDPWRYMKN